MQKKHKSFNMKFAKLMRNLNVKHDEMSKDD